MYAPASPSQPLSRGRVRRCLRGCGFRVYRGSFESTSPRQQASLLPLLLKIKTI